MRTILNLCLTAFIVVAFVSSSNAQNTIKEMDKKTKATLKEYIKDPASYRKMIKGYKDQIKEQEAQLAELEEDFYKADYLRILYYDSIQELHASGGVTTTVINNTSVVSNDVPSNTFPSQGTDYRVQLGAYRYFDFTQLLQLNEPIGFERVNGVIHYYLGSFHNAYEAYELAQAMRKLKIKDAFVTKYVDGNRIPYDHLLEGHGTAFYQE